MSLSSKPEIVPLSPGQEPPRDLLLLADPSQEQLEQYVHAGQCYLAQLGERTVGALVLLEDSREVMEIKNIAVAEAWQGQGIGRQLLRHARKIAKDEGYPRLRIATGNSSIGQLALYQQEGFDIIDIQKNYFMLHYPEPVFENGIRCRHLIILEHIL
jgi:ribosomal protein S18 acetylase RimI-like enzyme